jgi:hypothetical protein
MLPEGVHAAANESNAEASLMRKMMLLVADDGRESQGR